MEMEVFVSALSIFVLALFVGWEVITKVPPLLHTPLMSGANAISGITLVGTLVTSGVKLTPFTTVLGFVAVALATANVVGGFLVTHRMLGMFRRKDEHAGSGH
jgi:NAD(P) transhydrogenase subunit alpha